MRRTYISPEYQNRAVYGTLNMVEESTFFGAKMLEIEDSVLIDDQDVIYYQKDTHEQADNSIESALPSYIYSASNDKMNNHTLELDQTQSTYQLNNNTRWILTVDLKTILTNFIFANLKKYRTFEGVKNNMTLYNDVDVAMTNYITSNILNRYKFKNIELYVKYQDLRNQNLLRYKNTWSVYIINDSNKLTKIQTDVAYDDSSIKVSFNQEQPSSTYKFEYYFNILFEKV